MDKNTKKELVTFLREEAVRSTRLYRAREMFHNCQTAARGTDDPHVISYGEELKKLEKRIDSFVYFADELEKDIEESQ